MSGVASFDVRSGFVPAAGARVAVVGTGIAGLVAARDLQARHDITVFEAAPRIGGHTHTEWIDGPDGVPRGVDMGFIVYNERTYPLLTRLFADLGVATEESEMSFSVRSERTGIEWNGTDLGGVFAQRRNLLRPSFYRMIAGILRFHRTAPDLIDAPSDLTLGDLLVRESYPRPFVELYLLPMLAAIWSTEPGRILEFPVRTMAAFLHNHGMLTIDDRPQWRVVSGGSAHYLGALTAPYADRIEVSTPIERIRRVGPAEAPEAVELRAGGSWRRFDAVVVATHSDQALRLLDDPTDAERVVLGAIPYQDNEVVLHTDRRMMPRTRRAWAAWNYHLDVDGGDDGLAHVTYWMNRLQNLDGPTDYFVTLNRTAALDPDSILVRRRFAHPLFTGASLEAKRRWPEISRGRTTYCGAYWGFGFHEDGAVSGRRAAQVFAPADAPADAPTYRSVEGPSESRPNESRPNESRPNESRPNEAAA